ncbi:MAG: ABC transporter ATP-binding protein, partial [Propionibacteriaceae bacterium]|nr:ABC transporter ATP-binding protein [Propionibacteriaceae bacterium]
MLHLEDVRKTYRTGNFTQSALDGVTITFRDNEFVAVLGPSGSGKTTLLNIVGGLDHADDGDLVIDDISTEQYSDRQWDTYRNNRIGFVFQNYHLIPHQTVLANVELALTLSGVGPTERRERAIAALEQVELGDHIHKSPNQLSGGQMQRVAIARALINDPEIVLADEPTGALDTKTGDQVMGLLKQIAEKRLVVMVTHNPDLASQYATRIVSLRDGKVVSDTDPYIPTANAREAKTARRTSMSFFTAISLSFTNLLTKKGRTLMTSFAGSIGIVGIATILAVATGFNAYIRGIEESTLSLYPLQISSQAFDISSMMGGGTGSGLGGSRRDVGPDEVYEISMLSRMFSRVTTNDLRSLKAFLDSDSTNIGQWANSIDYHYSLTPQIFAVDSPDKVRQINPNNVFSSLGMGSDMNSLLMGGFSMNVFSALPDDVDFMIGQHEVVAGRWPQTPNECLVVLT